MNGVTAIFWTDDSHSLRYISSSEIAGSHSNLILKFLRKHMDSHHTTLISIPINSVHKLLFFCILASIFSSFLKFTLHTNYSFPSPLLRILPPTSLLTPPSTPPPAPLRWGYGLPWESTKHDISIHQAQAGPISSWLHQAEQGIPL